MDECNIMPRMVEKLLNNKNEAVSDKDTKLDVLAILSNVAVDKDNEGAKEAVKMVLNDVSDWFDDYMRDEEQSGVVDEDNNSVEPELHKSMLLLLSRAFDYCLKTEDVLELCRNDRSLALETVVGILEDGESYATELVQVRHGAHIHADGARIHADGHTSTPMAHAYISPDNTHTRFTHNSPTNTTLPLLPPCSHCVCVQRTNPGVGKVGQWEHELVTKRHEKPLILQMCRLLKGFTTASTYFSDVSPTADIKLHEVER